VSSEGGVRHARTKHLLPVDHSGRYDRVVLSGRRSGIPILRMTGGFPADDHAEHHESIDSHHRSPTAPSA